MTRSLLPLLLCGAALAAPLLAAPAPADAAPAKSAGQAHKSFRTAIYVVVNTTQALSDPATFNAQFDRMMREAPFDKVYVEVYRDRRFATDAQIEATKKAFEARGIIVSGGVTLAAGGRGGQFDTFDYEDPKDRAEAERAVRLAAKHFDEVILDDFFFYNTKSDADIAAKGSRSWTQYRLDAMRANARDLVLKPAHETNPKVKMIIKYPNWYEHFQGLGFDLDQEAHEFGGIYTGTETRDPENTDQLLQPYESYEIVRYFNNIRPDGGNGGGWVDTYSLRYVDRYAEQLWDTAFSKAPEITLFNWADLVRERAIPPGERDAWSGKSTSLDWNAATASGGGKDGATRWDRIAGYSLARVDKVASQLGKPLGIASYKPYQSSGEDFLQNYLGTAGLPIEMTPTFPTDAPMLLLTEQAKADPDIVAKIKGQLVAGKSVVITSGLLRALQDKGIKDVLEVEDTGRIAPVSKFLDGFGAGSGKSLNDPGAVQPQILFPALKFYTNDTWPVIRGVAADKGYPILLMNRYSKGVIYVLAIPENPGDLYNLPQAALTKIKSYILKDFPVSIDAPAHVSLFAYDNATLVVESFRPTESEVTVWVAGKHARLRDLDTGQTIDAAPVASPDGRTAFKVTLPAHSFAGFKIEG
jgi:hypothetical protein